MQHLAEFKVPNGMEFQHLPQAARREEFARRLPGRKRCFCRSRANSVRRKRQSRSVLQGGESPGRSGLVFLGEEVRFNVQK
jgi:hypothetical protein